MAYDAGRSRVVLFGGVRSSPDVYLADTWEHDGAGWLPGPPPPAALLPRAGHGMAYDTNRGRIVLYGGAGSSILGDAWDYDGVTYSRVSSVPPQMRPRAGHGMAYDGRRGRLVIHGGTGPSGVETETWEFDGTSWFQGPAGPSRSNHGMAYDGAGGRIVIYGSWNLAEDETWTYDGTAWTFLTHGPGGRYAPGMTYDPVRARIVMFGGIAPSGSATSETWELTGSSWSPGGAAPAGLAPRLFSGLAFDAARGRVVLFGGRLGGTALTDFAGDTWDYDGTWRPAPGQPASRSGHAMAYDADRGCVVLFGGKSGGELRDTWEFDGVAWRSAATTGPSARSQHAMAYHRGIQRTLLYGGSPLTSETWLWNGSTSTWLPGPSGPRRLERSAMAYHEGRQRTVLFGGYDGRWERSETWEFDGTQWLAGPSPPPTLWPRAGHAMAYDPGRGVIVLHGGSNQSVFMADTWHYDSSWSPGIAVPPTFDRRTLHGMAHAPSLQRIVLFGGLDSAGAYLGDTWEYGPAGWSAGPPSAAVSARSTMLSPEPAGNVILFGGEDGLLSGRGDTWRHASLDIAPDALPVALRGIPYGQVLTAAGGIAPYTFAVTSGVLPAGMSLATPGLLSGTPGQIGTFGFTVTAADALGLFTSQVFRLEVLDPGLAFLVGQGLGPSNPSRVRVFRTDGVATPVDFQAYATGGYGANVAGRTIDHERYDEILTGPGPGDIHGPHVRAFRRDGTPMPKVSFYAYGSLRFGVNVAGGGIDVDLPEEIVTGAGPGWVFGPHVRGFNFDGSSMGAIAKVSFFAYGTLQQGVNVTTGDLEDDGFHEMLTGPGPGQTFAAQVRGFDFDGTVLAPVPGLSFNAFPAGGFGVLVGAGDMDGDRLADIAATMGPGPLLPSRYLGYAFDGSGVQALPGFDVTPHATGYGGRVGVGNVVLGTTVRKELLTGAGRDPSAPSTVKAFRYLGGSLTAATPSFDPFAVGYGVNVASGALGF